MTLAGLCSLALGSLQAGQESVNNLQALSDTGCNLPSRDGGWGYCGADSCNIAYTGDASCEGGATCVCSSSRRRLLFATVPNKGKGEAGEECSCV